MTKEESTSNAHLTEYLKYYLALPDSPGYAVFINGHWGSGKTHYINTFKDENNHYEYLHITLYGVTSIDQVEEQLFQQSFPLIASKPFSIGSKILKKYLGTDILSEVLKKVEVKDLVEKSNRKILIFDDLERCEIINEILGYINHFIEYEGNKVILLGDDSKIKDEVGFKDKKEKTIGRFFKVEPNFKEAFEYMTKQVLNVELKSIYQNNFEKIITVFGRSDCKNLRSLKFSLLEFDRFYTFLPVQVQKHANFCSELIDKFFSISVEVRLGNLKISEISTIESEYYSEIGNSNQDEQSPLAIIRKRHFGEIYEDNTNLFRIIEYFFEKGAPPIDQLSAYINSHQYFLKDNTPSWKKLWHMHSLPDKDFQSLFKEVFTSFTQKEYSHIGELKHVAGMLLSYARKEIIGQNYDTMRSLCVSTIDNMIKEELINHKSYIYENRPFCDTYDGLVFQSEDDDAFKEIVNRIREYQAAKHELEIKQVANEIPSLMMNNKLNELGEIFNPSSRSYNKTQFYYDPIFIYINLDEFIEALLKMNPVNNARFRVFYDIKVKYQNALSYPALNKDKQALASLKEKIIAKKDLLSQPSKYHFQEIIPILEKTLSFLKDS